MSPPAHHGPVGISDPPAASTAAAVSGVQAELELTSEQLVLRLEEEKDKAVSEFKGMMEGDPDSAAALLQDADGVMGVVDKLCAASASWFAGAKGPAKGEELELQKLQQSERSPAERNLAKYSALGKVLVGGVAHAVAALPFGGPVAAALGAIFCQAVTVRLVLILLPVVSCFSCPSSLTLGCTCLPSILPLGGTCLPSLVHPPLPLGCMCPYFLSASASASRFYTCECVAPTDCHHRGQLRPAVVSGQDGRPPAGQGGCGQGRLRRCGCQAQPTQPGRPAGAGGQDDPGVQPAWLHAPLPQERL